MPLGSKHAPTDKVVPPHLNKFNEDVTLAQKGMLSPHECHNTTGWIVNNGKFPVEHLLELLLNHFGNNKVQNLISHLFWPLHEF